MLLPDDCVRLQVQPLHLLLPIEALLPDAGDRLWQAQQ